MLQEYCDRFFSDIVDPFIEGALKAVEQPINRGKLNEISSILESLRGKVFILHEEGFNSWHIGMLKGRSALWNIFNDDPGLVKYMSECLTFYDNAYSKYCSDFRKDAEDRILSEFSDLYDQLSGEQDWVLDELGSMDVVLFSDIMNVDTGSGFSTYRQFVGDHSLADIEELMSELRGTKRKGFWIIKALLGSKSFYLGDIFSMVFLIEYKEGVLTQFDFRVPDRTRLCKLYAQAYLGGMRVGWVYELLLRKISDIYASKDLAVR